mmetsp:Transcript_32742/g.37909  ORF Transcript_32742/g.37909 Transcript_32742/m.37909 type:complete len:250 (-) Transcript_32742:161-910(-)
MLTNLFIRHLSLIVFGSLTIYVQATPSVCISNPAIKGYSDVATLATDILYHRRVFSSHVVNGSDPSKYQGQVYILCPETVFSFAERNDKIPLFFPNTEIRCGSDGRSSNNCVFSGGAQHIYIYGDYAINEVISGVTFTKSTYASILAVASDKSYATFVDCNWEGNVGEVTILNHLNSLGDDDSNMTSNLSMKVHISDSSFRNNRNNQAVISTSSSDGFVITDTSFDRNTEPLIKEDNTIGEVVLNRVNQ